MSPTVYVAYKIAKLGVYPLTWILVLLVLALFASWRGHWRWLRVCVGSAFLLAYGLSLPPVARVLTMSIERRNVAPTVHERVGTEGRYDAVVVLAGGVQRQGGLRREDRLDPASLDRAYDTAAVKIGMLIGNLRRPARSPAPLTLPPLEPLVSLGDEGFTSTMDEAAFTDGVRRAKEFIAAGDAYQVVLSRRLDTELRADPFTVYRALRTVNPSPYLFFLRLGKTSIVGSSPEVLVRLEDERVEERPIAGTHPRGRTEEEDSRLADEMRADPKERAEHVMLVDLGRNDVGRVSRLGSVEVSEFMVVERYSHVMHLVSHVRGRLEPGRDAFDVLAACFPAGTLTGAPKIRAMEIIEELEPTRRGPYGGAVGYISYSGNLDSCITIRTVVCHGRHASIQVGAGIVADSDPKTEWLETCSKSRGMLLALRVAQDTGTP